MSKILDFKTANFAAIGNGAPAVALDAAVRQILHDCQDRPNLWLGTSVENQEQVEARIPHLLAVPAAVRFLSCEPLLGSIDLSVFRHGNDPDLPVALGTRWGLQWVIVGGESGHGARPMHPEWVRDIRDQCVAAGVPFFFKQWGEWIPKSHWSGRNPGEWGTLVKSGEWFPETTPWNGRDGDGGDAVMYRVGKDAAGRLLDGHEWNEFPEARHAH